MATAATGSYHSAVPATAGSSRGPRILAVRFSALGDVLLTTPLLRAIHRRHPDAEITFVTRRDYAPLLADSPRIREVVSWDPGAPFADLVARLAGRAFTHRLDLHGSLRSARLRLALGGRWTGYPKYRVRRALLVRTGRDRYRDRRPVAERYFDAARGLEVSPDGHPAELFLHRDAVARAERLLADHGLGRERTLVALAPGAAHATKRWPERHWHTLLDRLAGRADVVLVGGAADAALATRLATRAAGTVVSAAGALDLQGTAAVLRRARVVAAGDTGVMHMATAVGTPVVALYGPTVEAFGFFPYRARATVLQRTDLRCRPCAPHGGPRCPLGHHRCLEEILPEDVDAALRQVRTG